MVWIRFQKKLKSFLLQACLTDFAISHLIRSKHQNAVYIEDPYTSRHSVLVPYECPQIGSSWSTVLYQFMCYSSCIGGSQKPVKIILTLENK